MLAHRFQHFKKIDIFKAKISLKQDVGLVLMKRKNMLALNRCLLLPTKQHISLNIVVVVFFVLFEIFCEIGSIVYF